MAHKQALFHLGEIAVPATENESHTKHGNKNSQVNKSDESKTDNHNKSHNSSNETNSDNSSTVNSKSDSKSEKDAKQELKNVVSRSHEPMVEATTVFPFTLFPDTVIIDRTKITVVNRVFFFVANMVSIKLEDILNVTSSVGPFFGSIDIHTRYFDPGKPYSVNFLWRKDARRIDRILQGYSIAKEEKVDMTKLETKELAELLDNLGKTRNNE